MEYCVTINYEHSYKLRMKCWS